MRYKTPLNQTQNSALKDELTTVISANLKRLRKERQLTQQELAEQAGLHLTYVSHMEAGTYHPSTFVIWKIAQVLGVSISEFIVDEPQ